MLQLLKIKLQMYLQTLCSLKVWKLNENVNIFLVAKFYHKLYSVNVQ